jgi:hypothetical protein
MRHFRGSHASQLTMAIHILESKVDQRCARSALRRKKKVYINSVDFTGYQIVNAFTQTSKTLLFCVQLLRLDLSPQKK